MHQKILVYELNEVPWEIVDLYVAMRPRSTLARLVELGQCFTTVNRDPVHLQPWSTWPTLHCSMLTEEHNSHHLGQDPATFRGTPMWDAVDRAGGSVGLFGPLQSWPPKRFVSGGFHVPDTFAVDTRTDPPELDSFQAFNLAMTKENSFSSDARLSPRAALTAGATMLRRGLTSRSIATLVHHVVAELHDHRVRAGRSMMQALPSFDLYWHLHRRYRPDLSVFFTNHVAAMQHRFWGDFVPGYTDEYPYEADPVFAKMIPQAMDIADRQLGLILDDLNGRPNTRLVVAASMGQGPIEERNRHPLRVLEKPTTLLRALGIEDALDGLAMYPMRSVELPCVESARRCRSALQRVVDGCGRPVFTDVKVYGHSVTFRHAIDPGLDELSDAIFVENDQGAPRRLSLAEAGMTIRRRLGGGNTGYHTREGILITYQVGDVPRRERQHVDVLDVAPSLLEAMDVPIPSSMRGCPIPGLFQPKGQLRPMADPVVAQERAAV